MHINIPWLLILRHTLLRYLQDTLGEKLLLLKVLLKILQEVREIAATWKCSQRPGFKTAQEEREDINTFSPAPWRPWVSSATRRKTSHPLYPSGLSSSAAFVEGMMDGGQPLPAAAQMQSLSLFCAHPPTAWFMCLSSEKRKRLINLLGNMPFCV